MKTGVVVALVAALALSTGGEPGATVGAPPVLRPCGADTPVLCGTVVAPLDPSGSRPGSLRLHVEELPSGSTLLRGAPPAKVMFLVAGGPGQASAQAFELGSAVSFWRALFPGYTLVTYDDRGTGGSGRLSCPGLGAIVSASPTGTAAIVGACGRRLGSRSSLYSTRANASDMDAVRQALGADTVSLFGVSYGTKQVLGYALRYPSHVGRLVLDSVVSASWPDDYYSRVLQELPAGLDQLCRPACDGLTGTPGANFVKLANRLAADPVVGNVRRPGGRPTHVRLDGFALLELGLDTDLVPGVAAQLPADDSAALAGNPEPLERLLALDEQAVRLRFARDRPRRQRGDGVQRRPLLLGSRKRRERAAAAARPGPCRARARCERAFRQLGGARQGRTGMRGLAAFDGRHLASGRALSERPGADPLRQP